MEDMDIGIKEVFRYGRKEKVIYSKIKMAGRGAFAMELLLRGGICTGVKDAEDLTGRATMNLYPVDELVTRACEIADKTFNELKKRNWVLELPEPEDLKHREAKE